MSNGLIAYSLKPESHDVVLIVSNDKSSRLEHSQKGRTEESHASNSRVHGRRDGEDRRGGASFSFNESIGAC